MQLNLNEPGPPVLFDAELENTGGGPNESTIEDIRNFVVDVIENKREGGGMSDFMKKNKAQDQKTELWKLADGLVKSREYIQL